MSEKLAEVCKTSMDGRTALVIDCGKYSETNGCIIPAREHAVAAVIEIIKHHNITADELPCLWLSPDKAVDMQDYLIKWDDEDYPATCTFTGEWAAHVDDGCYENPDHIMPIPPLPGETP